MNQHLQGRKDLLAQVQREVEIDSLSQAVQTARGQMQQEVDGIDKLCAQLKARLTRLKTLANQAQPGYTELQRLTNPGIKPEEFLKISFTGLPLVTRRGENFSLEGGKLNLLWAEQEQKEGFASDVRARREASRFQARQLVQGQEFQKQQVALEGLERQKAAKQVELEVAGQKLGEARAAGYNTQEVEVAVAAMKREIANLSKQILDLDTEVNKGQKEGSNAA